MLRETAATPITAPFVVFIYADAAVAAAIFSPLR